jgi:SAM-dependent methyltransferase
VTVSFGRHADDLAYRVWAPWKVVGVRPELQRMVEGGVLRPTEHPNGIDLGCGSGANSVFLAAHGFEVTAVDFSRAGLRKAHRRAVQARVAENVTRLARPGAVLLCWCNDTTPSSCRGSASPDPHTWCR